MKQVTSILYLVLGAGLAFVSAARGDVSEEASTSKVAIKYVEPETFTDLESTYGTKAKARRAFMHAIEEEMEKRLRQAFGEEARLEMSVTNVDLAGRIDPVSHHPVRVLKDVWPPRMEFTYRIFDADGQIIAEGEKRLVDLGYIGFSIGHGRREAFHYEREMLKDWLRSVKRETASGA